MVGGMAALTGCEFGDEEPLGVAGDQEGAEVASAVTDNSSFYVFILFLMFIYFERHRASGGGAEREQENPRRAPRCQHRAPHRARSHYVRL